MTSKLQLDDGIIQRCRDAAGTIAGDVMDFARDRTTTSIERAVLRLLGVEGADSEGTPLVNLVVEAAQADGLLQSGIAMPFGMAMKASGLDAGRTAGLIAERSLALVPDSDGSAEAREMVMGLSEEAGKRIRDVVAVRDSYLDRLGEGARPLLYVIVASGDIHEDTVQAKIAARAGAQIVAVIRHTAQSLLDYVPEGAHTGGFGGTYASQDNFHIMRRALDDVSEAVGRYVRLCNYASGLCMPEMSALGAIERLDVMLNDSLYGILFRDINMQRTLTDQAFSRLISAAGGIMINTGEDNYLTTADPVEEAHTVLASDFINEALALRSGLKRDLIGLGHAMEMDPNVEDSFLLEIAQARMTREIFPDSPIKYMPPTKHMTGNIFRGHVQDSMFALSSVMTGQGIHLLGMMTEAMHTPHVHDRYLALEACRMAMISARHLSEEVEFRPGGRVMTRAHEVLAQAADMLESVAVEGLFTAIEKGRFADVSRPFDGGRGLSGVSLKAADYWNPVEEVLTRMVT